VKSVNLRSHIMLLNMITLSKEQSWASKIISQYLRNAKSVWIWEEPCVPRSIYRLNLLMSATHKRLFIGSYNKLIGRLTNSCWKELYLEFKIKWHEMSFYEQEIARKGRSSRSLRKEEFLPPLPHKKKASSKKKRKAVAPNRQYMSEFGHIVYPPHEEVIRSDDQNDEPPPYEGEVDEASHKPMTGPEIIQALGGSNARFSPWSRREARTDIKPKGPVVDPVWGHVPVKDRKVLEGLESGPEIWRKYAKPQEPAVQTFMSGATMAFDLVTMLNNMDSEEYPRDS